MTVENATQLADLLDRIVNGLTRIRELGAYDDIVPLAATTDRIISNFAAIRDHDILDYDQIEKQSARILSHLSGVDRRCEEVSHAVETIDDASKRIADLDLDFESLEEQAESIAHNLTVIENNDSDLDELERQTTQIVINLQAIPASLDAD